MQFMNLGQFFVLSINLFRNALKMQFIVTMTRIHLLYEVHALI